MPPCFNSLWHGVIPTSYFVFYDFYTCYVYQCLQHRWRLTVVFHELGTSAGRKLGCYANEHSHVRIYVTTAVSMFAGHYPKFHAVMIFVFNFTYNIIIMGAKSYNDAC